MKKAFTMIELIFVIVVIGILAGVAVPRFTGILGDSMIEKARSDIATIRSGISKTKQARLLSGKNNTYPNPAELKKGTNIFGGVAKIDIKDKTGLGNWHLKSTTGDVSCVFTYTTSDGDVDFTYTTATGIFDCDHTNAICKKLTE